MVNYKWTCKCKTARQHEILLFVSTNGWPWPWQQLLISINPIKCHDRKSNFLLLEIMADRKFVTISHNQMQISVLLILQPKTFALNSWIHIYCIIVKTSSMPLSTATTTWVLPIHCNSENSTPYGTIPDFRSIGY